MLLPFDILLSLLFSLICYAAAGQMIITRLRAPHFILLCYAREPCYVDATRHADAITLTLPRHMPPCCRRLRVHIDVEDRIMNTIRRETANVTAYINGHTMKKYVAPVLR